MRSYPAPRFDIIHGTNRPYGWQAVYSSYLRTADNPQNFAYHLVCDEPMAKYFRQFRKPGIDLIINPNDPCYVAASNYGASVTSAPILLIASDDMFPPAHWDTLLWELLNEDSTKHAVWVNDQCFPHISTMQILTRAWYDRYGFVFKPKFQSMLGDHDYTRRAVHDGVMIDVRDRPDLYWKHYHHRNGLRPADTSDEVNQSAERYAQGWKAIAEDWPEYHQTPLLDILYEAARQHPGDINEHMPFLKSIAKDATILELGVRSGCSSLAFLSGRPKKLVSVDIDYSHLDPQIPAGAMIENIDWIRLQQNSRLPVEGDWDIVFIDTLHTAEHVRGEIATHAPHAKTIIFHDTVTNWKTGEDGGSGIGQPISDFSNSNGWTITANFTNNNGLLVLSKTAHGRTIPIPWDEEDQELSDESTREAEPLLQKMGL